MISKIFHDNQTLISDYKEVIGPLSGNVFPFKQSYIDYKSYENPDFSLSGLRLVDGMKFNYGFYLWSNNESQKDGVRVSIDGHYEVDLNNELLTLNIENVRLWEPIGKFKGSQDVNKINQIFSENLKKFEVKNYNWFTRVILIKRPNIIPEGDLLNFAMYTQEDVELKLDNGISPNPQIVIIQNQIERLRKGPVINLPETYIYEVNEDKERISLSLNPDGSLSFIHTSSHWDRDGCYGSWDSE
jgi:hypothetical protein